MWRFLNGESEESAHIQKVDWDHPETHDEHSEDSFAVNIEQPYRSLQKLINQVNNSWKTTTPGLIRAAETNDSDIDIGDIADLETNTSYADESSFFTNWFFDIEVFEKDAEKSQSKNRRIN